MPCFSPGMPVSGTQHSLKASHPHAGGKMLFLIFPSFLLLLPPPPFFSQKVPPSFPTTPPEESFLSDFPPFSCRLSCLVLVFCFSSPFFFFCFAFLMPQTILCPCHVSSFSFLSHVVPCSKCSQQIACHTTIVSCCHVCLIACLSGVSDILWRRRKEEI